MAKMEGPQKFPHSTEGCHQGLPHCPNLMLQIGIPHVFFLWASKITKQRKSSKGKESKRQAKMAAVRLSC
jgi:hypothetical protein